MNKITILSGISGSGKSTYAKKMWENDPLNQIIVSRDKIRELLFGFTEATVDNYYKLPNLYELENKVSDYQDALIENSLQKGQNVIIDNTNLKMKYLREFYDKFSAEFDFKFFDIELDEAIMRDSLRARKVGETIIRKQFQQYKELKKNFKKAEFENPNAIGNTVGCFNIDSTLPKCIVVDIDGTLAHMHDRDPFDWSKVGEDTLDEAVWTTVKSLKNTGYTVVICSGRDSTCKEETIGWLNKHHVPYEHLYMRAKGDMRKDYIIKEELWREICKTYYVAFMLDDRQAVVDKARALGFKVFQVEPNMF